MSKMEIPKTQFPHIIILHLSTELIELNHQGRPNGLAKNRKSKIFRIEIDNADKYPTIVQKIFKNLEKEIKKI